LRNWFGSKLMLNCLFTQWPRSKNALSLFSIQPNLQRRELLTVAETRRRY
jgi:hypothetical protein